MKEEERNDREKVVKRAKRLEMESKDTRLAYTKEDYFLWRITRTFII